MKYTITIALLLCFSCGDEENPQELINKLRAVGVDVLPKTYLTIDPGSKEPTEVTLEAYLLMPKEVSIDVVESFKDDKALFPINITTGLDQVKCGEQIEEKYKDLSPLKLCKVTGKASLEKSYNSFLINFKGLIPLRYGFKIKAQDEQEIIVGDFYVVDKNKDALAWNKHSINIDLPLVSGATPLDKSDDDKEKKEKRFDIKAILNKADNFEENIKIGWYVSSGKVKNSRSLETTWSIDEDKTGGFIIFITSSGTKSKFFDFDARKIAIE